MAKKDINIFQKSKEIEANENARVSDVDYLETLKQRDKQAETPPIAPKEKSKKSNNTKRTTAVYEESYDSLIRDIIHTIRSSGEAKTLPQGDYALKNQDFWEQAITALKEKTEKLYGEIKKAPL